MVPLGGVVHLQEGKVKAACAVISTTIHREESSHIIFMRLTGSYWRFKALAAPLSCPLK